MVTNVFLNRGYCDNGVVFGRHKSKDRQKSKVKRKLFNGAEFCGVNSVNKRS